ncbi:MAG TPA: polyprenol monophosphomannose synthase [Calditrichia bacterium]|nr:polyprenol monophosphomannose synthase [Calditrichota bacterium]HQU73842.1 polyprenol monophosphomannose synthase [Calditrichia bacterium]HQV33494.1 polyprenol monophosphomannose synthase [Calditrichia bacterium]
MDTSRTTLLIIPTYNEYHNINTVLDIVFGLGVPGLSILVVDDNSPDGTAQLIRERMESEKRLHLLERPGKMGLGTAYIAGFRYAIEHGFDYVMEMDADLSHDPKVIPTFVANMEEADLVVGSRYLGGVNVINWPLRRLILSTFASKYTRFVTGLPLHDCTSGFKCFRREVLEAIPLDEVHSNGYSFQIEMNFKAWKRKFRIKEIPIIFTDRTLGQSKMSRKIVLEAMFMVWKLKVLSLVGRY